MTQDAHLNSCKKCRDCIWNRFESRSFPWSPLIDMPSYEQHGYWRLRWTREYCESRLNVPNVNASPRFGNLFSLQSPSTPENEMSEDGQQHLEDNNFLAVPVFFHRIRYAQPTRSDCPMKRHSPKARITHVKRRLATQWTRLRAHDAGTDAADHFVKLSRKSCPKILWSRGSVENKAFSSTDRAGSGGANSRREGHEAEQVLPEEQDDAADEESVASALQGEAECVYRFARWLPSELLTKTFDSHYRKHFVCQKVRRTIYWYLHVDDFRLHYSPPNWHHPRPWCAQGDTRKNILEMSSLKIGLSVRWSGACPVTETIARTHNY
ncbi:unnamed protein product [Amoebophrya sp. A25]|nr:unnamed protein product [Amoebophrya sp. A25]|eukprot:GSA25T00017627001.1